MQKDNPVQQSDHATLIAGEKPSSKPDPVIPPVAPTRNEEAHEPPPRRLRRLHRVWPDREGNISYLVTPCIEGRLRVLNNESTFQQLVDFLLDSPARYGWFGRRFVIMPDHIHLIAHQGLNAIRLGLWMKSLKAVVGGLQPRADGMSISTAQPHKSSLNSNAHHLLTRQRRAWRWQSGFHDHKSRTPESEARKWEYVCLNPVRYQLVSRPEDWPYGGEVFYDEAGGPRLIRGTPPILETGILIAPVEEDGKITPSTNSCHPDAE